MQRTYQSSLLSRTSLDDRHRAILAERGSGRSFNKGTIIQQRGSDSAGFWLIETGEVTLCRYDGEGGVTVYGVLGPGDLFGELAYFAGIPRQVDAIAESDVRMVFIGRSLCDELLAGDPGFAKYLLGSLAGQLRAALDQVEAGRLLKPRDRLLRLLADQAALGHLEITCTQQELADHVGVSRVTIGTLIADLKRQGLVTQSYRTLQLNDPGRLARFAADQPGKFF